MKIVFVAPFGIRPKGTVIARMLPLAAELQKLGHRVVIVAPPYTNPEDSGKTEVLRGVTLKNVRLGPRHKALAAPFLTWRLFSAALQEKPDLVHLFKPKGYGGLAAMLHLCAESAGVRLPPLFLDTDDWEGKGGMNDLVAYSSAERRLYAFQEQWLPPRMRGVTVASRALEGLVLKMGVARQRLLYLPNCVEGASRGDGRIVRERLGIAPDAPVVLLYTRFFEFSQEKLHRVFAEIHRRLPQVRFLVVGKGRHGEEGELARAAAAGGFGEALAVAGWVEPGALPDFLAAAEVAIYPFDDTLLNRCKCPAKLTELLQAGVPVVADRVGQIAEYVGDECGVLCEPTDPMAMASAVLDLLRDPQRRRAVGEAGSRYIHQRFAWPDAARRLEQFYRLLCKEGKGTDVVDEGGCGGART